MPFKIVNFLFLSFVVAFSSAVYSGAAIKEHGHKTLHGGVIQETEGLHAEFLLDKSGEPKLYLYDKTMKPLEKTDLQARLAIKGRDGAQESRDLKAFKDPKEGIVYKGEPIKGFKDWNSAAVSIKVKDRWVHFQFSHH